MNTLGFAEFNMVDVQLKSLSASAEKWEKVKDLDESEKEWFGKFLAPTQGMRYSKNGRVQTEVHWVGCERKWYVRILVKRNKYYCRDENR